MRASGATVPLAKKMSNFLNFCLHLHIPFAVTFASFAHRNSDGGERKRQNSAKVPTVQHGKSAKLVSGNKLKIDKGDKRMK